MTDVEEDDFDSALIKALEGKGDDVEISTEPEGTYADRIRLLRRMYGL